MSQLPEPSRGARFARTDGVSWLLAEIATRSFDWDGGGRINADSATLASVSQMQGESRDWRARDLRATDVQWALPDDVQAATLSAERVDGGSGTVAWEVASVNTTGLRSSEDDGQKAELLESGALAVTDKGNGAALSVERADPRRIEFLVKERSSDARAWGRLALSGDPPRVSQWTIRAIPPGSEMIGFEIDAAMRDSVITSRYWSGRPSNADSRCATR